MHSEVNHEPLRLRLSVKMILSVSLAFGLLVGIGTHSYKKGNYVSAMTVEAQTLLSLTSSYVSTYSEIVQRHLDTSAPVPAEFRAKAATAFNQKHGRNERFLALMVGMPGREIATPPIDATMEKRLATMADAGEFLKYSRLLRIDDEPVLRTVFPSVASKDSCVNCHNRLQQNRHTWSRGDLMGAYVIDRGIGMPLADIHRTSCILGFLSATVFLLALLLHRHHRQLKDQTQRLRYLANTDPLTRCLNRRALFKTTSELLARPVCSDSVFMLDIDYFKRINDEYGHDAGDEVLKRFAELVRQSIRETDILARVGGEEFVVYLPGVTAQESCEIAHRIRRVVAETPVTVCGVDISFTVSIGGVRIQRPDQPSIESWLTQADQCLYQAKQLGRNCVVLPYALDTQCQSPQ